MRETWVGCLGWENPLEEGMATHSSIHAWRIPWTEEPCSLQSKGRKESDTTEATELTSFSVIFKIICLVSWGCHKKTKKITNWLETAEIHCLTVLEIRSPKQRCWQGHALAEGASEGLFLACSLASGGFQWPWCSLACKNITALSPRHGAFLLPVCVQPAFLFLQGHPVTLT